MCNVNDYVNYTVYTIDKFHIQWCLYPMMDLWNIINEMKKRRVNWVSHVICVEKKRNAYRVLVGKLKVRKRPLGRPRH